MVNLTDFINFVNMYVGENSSQDWLLFLGFFILLSAAFILSDKYVIAILKKATKKTKFQFDDAIVGFLEGIHAPFYIYLAFFISAQSLNLVEHIDNALNYILIIFIGFYAALGLTKVIDHFANKQIERKRKSDSLENTSMILVLALLVKIGVWIIAFLMILANFGIEIAPLIAALGVGGIAIALALQTVLSDFFSALAIYFDKPFKEGDFIIVGGEMGVVKHIGIKTTRIQALGGQEIVMSNSDLINSRINNYKRMEKRRVVFQFGVVYGTELAKLKKVPKIVSEIIKNVKEANLDRVHFYKFGESSLDFEVVYYVPTADYNKYMDIQQEINVKIVEAFQKEKIEFAFPSRTIYFDESAKEKKKK